MSIKDKFRRVVTDPNDLPAHKSLTQEIARYTESSCLTLAGLMCQLLEDKNESPLVKLYTLKLLDHCMQASNTNLLLAVQSRLLERLGVIARHKHPSADPQRGSDLFGYKSLASPQDTQASIEFLRLLLVCLRKWAMQFQEGPDGRESPYSILFKILTKEGVSFEGVDQPPTPRRRPKSPSHMSKRFLDDVETIKTCARTLIEKLSQGIGVASPLVAELQNYQTQLYAQIEARTTKSGSEIELQMLLEASDAVSQALERFEMEEKRKGSEEAKSPAKPVLQQAADDIDQRIAAIRGKITDLRNELFTKRTVAQGQKSPEMVRKDVEEKIAKLTEAHYKCLAELSLQDQEDDMRLPGIQQQVFERQAVVDNMKQRRNEVAVELEEAHRQLTSIRLENVAMKEKLKGLGKSALSPASKSSEAFFGNSPDESDASEVDPKDFETQRYSGPGLEVSIPWKQRISDVPVCNTAFFRQACLHEQSPLYEDEAIVIGYQSRISELEGMLRIFIANKSDDTLQGLSVFVSEEPVEGIRIDHEGVAPIELTAQNKVYRVFRLSVFRPFQTPPLLLLKYTQREVEKECCLQLPIIYPHFIRSAEMTLDRISTNWEGLKEWEAAGEFSALHTDIKSMADVCAVARFKDNFLVMSGRELPELGRGRALAMGQIKEYLIWALVSIEPSSNSRPGGRVAVRCRNQESRACLLKILLEFLSEAPCE